MWRDCDIFLYQNHKKWERKEDQPSPFYSNEHKIGDPQVKNKINIYKTETIRYVIIFDFRKGGCISYTESPKQNDPEPEPWTTFEGPYWMIL